MAITTPEEFLANRTLPTVRPVDAAFIQDIMNELNEECGLSVNIDPKKILRQIRKVARYVYKHYQYMTLQQKVALLRYEDFKDSYAANGGMYATVTLPNSIEGLWGISPANNGSYGTSSRILDIPLLRSVSLTQAAGGFSIQTNAANQYNYSVSDATIALYEQASYQNHFQSGFPFSFSHASKELVIRPKVRQSCGVILGVYVQTDISNLYNDYYFREHVMGECMISAARIFGTFDIELGGGATINWKDIKDDGREKVDECKDHYKTTTFMPKTFFKGK